MKTLSTDQWNRFLPLLLTLALAAAPARMRAADQTETEAAKAAADQAHAEADQAREKRDQAHEKERQERDQSRREHDREMAYKHALQLMEHHQLSEAARAFDELAKAGGERGDGAFYWKAYIENKLGKREQAVKTLAELSKTYPESRWSDDAKALEAEARQAGGQPGNPDAESDEDLKLMALNGLMESDAERALPMLEKLLKGNQSPKIKERALFVLSQSDSPKAREIVGNFARGKSNPDVQLKALEYLALFGGKESRQTLAEVYASSSDAKVKRAILGYFMVGGDREHLFAMAKGEKDEKLRRDAIEQLGVLNASDELSQLYQTETALDAKKKIIDAMFTSGNPEKLIELARNEKDPELRRHAVRALGPMEGAKAAAGLVEIYRSDKDKTIRKVVIESLFMQGNAKALVELARKETDPDLKKKFVEQISIMQSKEGADYLLEILNK